MNIIFAILSLILNYFSLKLTIAIYKGLFIGYPLLYIFYNPYIPIRSSDIARRHFWPVKAWDSWPSPLVLKVGNAKKVPAPP